MLLAHHEREPAAAEDQLPSGATRPRSRQQLGWQEGIAAGALRHRDCDLEREGQEVVVTEPLLAPSHVLELIGNLAVLLDERLVRARATSSIGHKVSASCRGSRTPPISRSSVVASDR